MSLPIRGAFSSEEYLAHHGIKGQKWGVRRYQNPDGSLTAAGQKRYNTLNAASEYAKKQAKSSRLNAKDFQKDPDIYKKKYMEKGGEERWIKDMYGSKQAFIQTEEPRDPIKFAREAIKNEYREVSDYSKMMSSAYMEESAKWQALAEKYGNTPIVQVSKKDYNKAKKYAKQYAKDVSVNSIKKLR